MPGLRPQEHALAHPARIKILQHLVLDGPATATGCAQVAGLSPSACSCHRRAMARFGFVEEDPGSAGAGLSQDILHLTAEELGTLRSSLQDTLAACRRLDPATRPQGARRVHAMFDLVPWFDPDAG